MLGSAVLICFKHFKNCRQSVMGKMLGLGARNALSGHPSPTRDANRDSGGNFQVLEGGGEYNTSRGLCKGFGYLPKFVSVPTGIFLWCWEFISSPTLGDTN